MWCVVDLLGNSLASKKGAKVKKQKVLIVIL